MFMVSQMAMLSKSKVSSQCLLLTLLWVLAPPPPSCALSDVGHRIRERAPAICTPTLIGPIFLIDRGGGGRQTDTRVSAGTVFRDASGEDVS